MARRQRFTFRAEASEAEASTQTTQTTQPHKTMRPTGDETHPGVIRMRQQQAVKHTPEQQRQELDEEQIKGWESDLRFYERKLRKSSQRLFCKTNRETYNRDLSWVNALRSNLGRKPHSKYKPVDV